MYQESFLVKDLKRHVNRLRLVIQNRGIFQTGMDYHKHHRKMNFDYFQIEN